jgi:hypothetical protein
MSIFQSLGLWLSKKVADVVVFKEKKSDTGC